MKMFSSFARQIDIVCNCINSQCKQFIAHAKVYILAACTKIQNGAVKTLEVWAALAAGVCENTHSGHSGSMAGRGKAKPSTVLCGV